MENHVKEMLKRFSLDYYYKKFIEHGYDNADFLKQMTESQILRHKLQNDVEMMKNGHIMRFGSTLKALKIEDTYSASDVNSTEEVSSVKSPPAIPVSLESVSKLCSFGIGTLRL